MAWLLCLEVRSTLNSKAKRPPYRSDPAEGCWLIKGPFRNCTLLFSQTALVSFATTGEKTVAAVMTCRNEVVSVEDESQHLGVSFFMSARSPGNQKSGHNLLVTLNPGSRRLLRNKFSLHL